MQLRACLLREVQDRVTFRLAMKPIGTSRSKLERGIRTAHLVPGFTTGTYRSTHLPAIFFCPTYNRSDLGSKRFQHGCRCLQILTLPPTRSLASKMVTWAPCWLNMSAARNPATPAPITQTRKFRLLAKVRRNMVSLGCLPIGNCGSLPCRSGRSLFTLDIFDEPSLREVQTLALLSMT